MIRAGNIDIKKKTDKVSVVIIANAVVDPGTVVILCDDQ
jgi:hypothetical protein